MEQAPKKAGSRPSENVYRYIEQKILSQEWTPGTKIESENQLSQKLGASRISVREAIEKMVALDVLTKKQGGGTFVNELSTSSYLNGLIPMILLNKDNLMDVLEFREMIEASCARLCAERCEEATIRALEENYQTMCQHNNKSAEFAEADYQFHMEIAQGTNNTLMIKVNSLLTDIWKFLQEEFNRYLGPARGVEEHQKILESIRNRDPELAELFMKRHIQRTRREIQAIKDQQDQQDEQKQKQEQE
ncbi:FadR/GntR family transcriptional regulator [Anoxynatronum sibiricum]|uniref:FadR/GntR family transcriptional regulator n=1 Tax=Anoxynatronum sibiricum TaxID=210623 RepID=A0ABU9VWL1_9CLOT